MVVFYVYSIGFVVGISWGLGCVVVVGGRKWYVDVFGSEDVGRYCYMLFDWFVSWWLYGVMVCFGCIRIGFWFGWLVG